MKQNSDNVCPQCRWASRMYENAKKHIRSNPDYELRAHVRC